MIHFPPTGYWSIKLGFDVFRPELSVRFILREETHCWQFQAASIIDGKRCCGYSGSIICNPCLVVR